MLSIQGMPDISCNAVCCGYHRYDYQQSFFASSNRNALCLTALSKGFSKIIILDKKNGMLVQDKLECESRDH
jgi:hypothetical protein